MDPSSIKLHVERSLELQQNKLPVRLNIVVYQIFSIGLHIDPQGAVNV
jgi:hypothetical protein